MQKDEGASPMARQNGTSVRVRGRNRVARMSSRLDRTWIVLASHQIPGADRCVDVSSRPNGTFGFEEFRQDPEDMGSWTRIAYFSARAYPTADEALTAAKRAVPWFATFLNR